MRDLRSETRQDLPCVNALMPLRARGLRLAMEGREVLRGLDLTLSGAGTTVIMGANGAGKSVLLRVLHGLTQPDEGQVLWGDLPAAQARRDQAMVFQSPVLLRRSALANLRFALKARGRSKTLAPELLARVGLADQAHQPARKLSGGQQQRLAIARALAMDPKVLFLDEPTASLDPASTHLIEEILRQIRAEGVRIVLVTHDAGQARRLADDVVFLNAGRVCEHSPAEMFFPWPQSSVARDYLDGRIQY
jgi:tungstate transport system ATP-binding protein